MKILITGGAGYIGSILVPELVAKKYTVTVVDNFMFKQHSLGHICAHPNFEITRGDARDGRVVGEWSSGRPFRTDFVLVHGARESFGG